MSQAILIIELSYQVFFNMLTLTDEATENPQEHENGLHSSGVRALVS